VAKGMKRSAIFALAALPIACIAAPDFAQAENVLAKSTMVSGIQSNRYEFNAPGPGTLSVTLTDMTWPERLTSLTADLYSPTSVLGKVGGDQSVNFEINSQGLFAAVIFATAGNNLGLNMGSFSVSIDYRTSAPEVPLPPAVTALLTGLALLGLARVHWASSDPAQTLSPAV